MADILNESGQKVATMSEDNKVRNLQAVVIGSVLNNGDVYSSMGQKIGHVDGRGYVYEGENHIGTVHNDGTVYDYSNHRVGKVIGGHIESGGAALLLLVM